MSEIVLSCRNVTRSFREARLRLEVLRGANIDVCRGECVAIVGASGCGKSTLLHILGGLAVPDTGSVSIAGRDLASSSRAELARVRNQHLGFVYQFHHLLAEFSALENVAMPLLVRGEAPRVASERARELLERIGLAARAGHLPAELSGGERQRVAIARALAGRPAVLLADEPTGNLDETTAIAVQDLLLESSREEGTALVVVTHDSRFAARMERTLHLHDGVLADGVSGAEGS